MQTPIEKFAEDHRLKVTRDECNDQIIQGSRAHLYFDDDQLCLMGLATRVAGMAKEKIDALGGGDVFIGDIFRDQRNRGHRDVWVKSIPMANATKAIKLARCRTAVNISEAERERRRAHGKLLASMQANKKHAIDFAI